MAKGVVVSVLNMKGGVGKTTISAHVMRVLFEQLKKSVLLVDLDPQFNLSQTVLDQRTYELLKLQDRTVFAAMEPPPHRGLFEVNTTHQAPPKATTLAQPLWNFRDKSAVLQVIPGNFELVKYSLIDDRQKLDAVQQRFLRFISDAKNDYDLIVIDCNPSSSFITLCALHACSQLLVPVRPDKYSILGLELVADFLERVPTIHPKPEITILLNGIPSTNYDPAIERSLRAHTTFGKLVLANRLRQSTFFAATINFTGFATDRRVPHRERVLREIGAIVNELGDRWGLK